LEDPLQKTAGLALTLVASLAAGAAGAQEPIHVVANHAWCDRDGDQEWGRERYCEVREATWAGSSARTEVDASPNGGIEVRGWDRPSVKLEAKVVAMAETVAEARGLVDQVQVETGPTVRATGPTATRHRHWSVTYRLSVPRRASLGLRSVNGGISLTDVTGAVRLETTNGGIRLDDVGGRVEGRTTNGGLDIRLAGSGWTGEGLDVLTTNGGVTLAVPADYNARVETGTTNGGLQVDFPVTLQGRIDRRHVSFEVGKGGPLVRALTTNGGVTVRKR
jgi:hypothetical protein